MVSPLPTERLPAVWSSSLTARILREEKTSRPPTCAQRRRGDGHKCTYVYIMRGPAHRVYFQEPAGIFMTDPGEKEGLHKIILMRRTILEGGNRMGEGMAHQVQHFHGVNVIRAVRLQHQRVAHTLGSDSEAHLCRPTSRGGAEKGGGGGLDKYSSNHRRLTSLRPPVGLQVRP